MNQISNDVTPESAEETKNPLKEFFMYSGGALLFLAVTIFYTRDVWLTWQAWNWEAVSCKIVEFDAPVKVKGKYNLTVSYDYTYGGAPHTASVYKMTGNFTRSAAVLDKFKPGTETTCYVNPALSTQAVLDRSLGIGDFGYPAGGMAFTGLCAFIAVHSFKQWRKKRAGGDTPELEPVVAAHGVEN